MKKIFAILAATMILSSGCGNNVEEVKQEAASEIQETADKVGQKATEIAGNALTTSSVDSKDTNFSIAEISPGMSLDEAKKILGEPTSQYDNDEFTFSNGVIVETDKNIVEEIKITQAGVSTAAGVAVGMTEQSLTAAYGQANSTENDDGFVEHEYYSGDGRLKLSFYISNGTIAEIKCSLRD